MPLSPSVDPLSDVWLSEVYDSVILRVCRIYVLLPSEWLQLILFGVFIRGASVSGKPARGQSNALPQERRGISAASLGLP